MKKSIILLILMTLSMQGSAQTENRKIFQTYLYNEDYQVWLDINFYDNNIIVPSQELFGELPGYFGAKRDTRKWLITDASIKVILQHLPLLTITDRKTLQPPSHTTMMRNNLLTANYWEVLTRLRKKMAVP